MDRGLECSLARGYHQLSQACRLYYWQLPITVMAVTGKNNVFYLANF